MTVTDAGVWSRAIVDEEPGGPVRKRLMTHASVASPALIDLEFTLPNVDGLWRNCSESIY
jgi:hypothetical protein